LGGAVAALRRMPRTYTNRLQIGRGSIAPWMRAKIAAGRRQWRRIELGASLASLRRALDKRLTRRTTGLVSSDWKPYAIIATLLASLAIETFFFGGFNAVREPEVNSRPVPVLDQSGAARTLVKPLEPAPVPAVNILSDPEPPPRAVNHTKSARAADRAHGGADNLHHGALNSKRTVTYRADAESHSKRAVIQEARGVEPAARSPEKSAAKLQLNVRWEN
jgi:hypothetical protein